MTDNYFSKFPQIRYNDTLCRNISERVSIVSNQRRIPTQYYPYELKDGLRADVLSWGYYEDPTLDWLIYLTNGMTDPYYDWYLSSDEFNNYIITKYGSTEAAQQQIMFYRNNWSDDFSNVTLSGYNALTETLKKYWTPVYGERSRILFYERRKEDWVASTNQVVRLDITLTSSNTFNVGEILDTNVGSGTIAMSSNTELLIQHVSGNTLTNSITATGRISGATATIDYSQVMQYNIPLVEQAYWSPVTAWDVEYEENEQKKFLYVLDAGYAMPTSETIRRQLNT